MIDPSGVIRKHPGFPSEDMVKPARFVETRDPYLVADGLALVTGEIPRRTPFETGFQQHRAFIGGRWEPDPWIWDECALMINVKRRGLIVLSGCGHAGIINTILYHSSLPALR